MVKLRVVFTRDAPPSRRSLVHRVANVVGVIHEKNASRRGTAARGRG